MKNVIVIFTLLILSVGSLSGIEGNSKVKKNHGIRTVTGTPTQTIVDINNMTTWVRSDGFFDWAIDNSWNGTYPKGTIGDIYSQGIVWGGFVRDGQTPELRVGGSTYETGLVSGAILTDATGKVTGREDVNASDVRIFRVRPDWSTGDLRDDASNLLQKPLDQVTDDDMKGLRDQYLKDWLEWPAQKGAPFQDRDGTPGYQPDANGRTQDAVGKLFDIPGIADADQTVWYVANDNGPNAKIYGAPSIGLEMQMTIWAYTSELFSNIQFKRVRLIYKGTPKTPTAARIDSMYITQWADPDNGDYSDDFAGCDTTLSLGFDYNGSPQDAFYRDRFGLAPPAVGFDFLQGVIVPGRPTDTAIFDFKVKPGYKNLPMTTFSYFAAGSARQDPDLDKYSGTNQWYNLMRGAEPRPEYPSFVPFRDNLGRVTRFELSGDPVAGTGDLDGRVLGPGDRRILLATGPFSMARGDTQEVVIAQVDGLGGDAISSVAIMKNNDRFAQAAYDKLFKELPGAPPPPSVKVTELPNEIVLNWGGDATSIASIEDVDRQGWVFEGYNVYQMPSANSQFPGAALKIATYDLKDNILAITNRTFDPTAKIFLNEVRQIGSDAGVKRFISIKKDLVTGKPLVNGQTYYYVVTAYSYNSDSTVDFHALESRAQVLSVVPQSPKPGVKTGESSGQVLAVNHVSGNAQIPDPAVTVVDPTVLTGHVYQVGFDQSGGTPKWILRDSTAHRTLVTSTKLGSIASADPNDDFGYPIVDGITVEVKETEIKMIEDSTRWVSANPAWLQGIEFTDVSAGFNGGVTTGYQLPNYFSHIETGFSRFLSFPVEVRFNAANPQKAYRLERTGPHAGYEIQPTNSFTNVPFSVWDMSNPGSPRQLTVAWRDQDDDGTWNPPEADDGLEIVFIYNKTYNSAGTGQFTMPPGAVEDECTKGAKADIVYGLSLGVSPGHTLNESVGTLKIVPDVALHYGVLDRYLFNTVRSDTSLARAKSDINRINVFPNPYYGFNSRETDRLAKYVTFNHLPSRATIRIFNLSGVLVRTIEKDDLTQFVRWNLRNDNNLPIASGVYIAYIDMPGLGNTKTLKLAIVQEEQIMRTY